MDDPWGSPWADESPRPLPKLDKPVSKRPVTPGKASGVSQDSRSPWDDDDGFGEWATLPAMGELQANVQDGPEQAESVEWNTSVNEDFIQAKDHIRPDGSTWFSREIPHTNGESPGLETPQVTGSASLPDPWAREAAGAEEKVGSSRVAKWNACEESTTDHTNGDSARGGMATVENEDEEGTQANGELDKSVPPNVVEGTSIGKPFIDHDQDEPTKVLSNTTAGMLAEDVAQGESLASRPSSSPSDHSHHGKVLTESPRTSFEEEEKRPKLEREGSSKVKEMVRLFDGLAVGEGSAELPGHPGGADALDDHFDTPAVAQSEDDFGDFEEGVSYVTTKAKPVEEAPTIQPETPLYRTEVTSDSAPLAGAKESATNLPDEPVKHHGPVNFEIDLSALNHIFEETLDKEFAHADPKQAQETDTVIQDSFSSTDERKIWYRISRYGTMRKHNAGDEDSYVRINWNDSIVRAETLKIVERWIEEDRIGGGVILGGGTRLESMFGWGQKNAAPMSVAAALASRSGREVMRSDDTAVPMSIMNPDASPTHGSDPNRKSLEQMSASRKSFQSPASAIVPQFSWSSGTPISATADATPPILPPLISPNSNRQAFGNSISSPKVAKESSLRSTPASATTLVISKTSSAQSPKIVSDSATKLGKHSSNQKVLEPPANEPRSEADDWGEMISSPALENPPPIKQAVEVQTNSVVREALSSSLPANSPAMHLDHTSDWRSNERMIAQSDGGPFISLSVEDHAIKLETPSSTARKSDAWATADFSFFDSPAPSRPTLAPPTPTPKASIPSPIPVKQSPGLSREQVEQDRIVKSIVQNLPDLSYMLRR